MRTLHTPPTPPATKEFTFEIQDGDVGGGGGGVVVVVFSL
jgi:hypothetical protein